MKSLCGDTGLLWLNSVPPGMLSVIIIKFYFVLHMTV